MADLGSIGKQGLLTEQGMEGPSGAFRYVRLLGPAPVMIPYSGRDDTQGTPLAPSFKMGKGQTQVGPIEIPLQAGTWTISISVKYTPNATPRPQIRIKAHPYAALEDTIAVAPSGTAFVTISAQVMVRLAAVLEMYLEVPHIDGIANWDNITIT